MFVNYTLIIAFSVQSEVVDIIYKCRLLKMGLVFEKYRKFRECLESMQMKNNKLGIYLTLIFALLVFSHKLYLPKLLLIWCDVIYSGKYGLSSAPITKFRSNT